MRAPFALGVVSCMVLTCPTHKTTPPTQDELIYTAVLDSVARQGTMIVLADSGPILQSWAPVEVLRTLRTRLPVHLVRFSEIAPDTVGTPATGDDYWTRFRTRFPEAHGWYTVSTIRYSDANHATVSYGHFCGWLCAEGGPVELERSGDGWIVTSIRITFVS
jgi:hypothetical protein